MVDHRRLELIAIDLKAVQHMLRSAGEMTTILGGNDAPSLRHMAILVQTVRVLEARLVTAFMLAPAAP